MTDIDKAIAVVEENIKSYSNPGTYCESEYYTRCDAKVSVLEDVLYALNEIKKGNK